MAKLTKGTQIFFIDPELDSNGDSNGPAVISVQCATAFSPGGNPADQIETTCLEDFDRSYQPGLRTPGQASLTINADPENDSHVRMHQLSEENPQPVLKWAVGWSDGTAAPDVDSAGDFVLPDSRTWFVFEGYISDFPFDFSQNAVVTSNISIQRSGGASWVKKAGA